MPRVGASDFRRVPKIDNWQHSHGQHLQRFQRVRIKEERHNTIYPRFGSRAGSFLTQRRKGAEKTVFLCFLKVIFIFATPYKRHPIGEDSLCQKNSRISHFPTELHFFSALLCILRPLAALRVRFAQATRRRNRLRPLRGSACGLG